MKLVVFIGIFALNAAWLYSQSDSLPKRPLFFIKPEVSAGVYVNGKGYFNWQAGLSAFHFANLNQRYGFTVNYINIDLGKLEYISTGIVIEMNMFRYLYARVGTVGYLSLHDPKGHLFGITSNIGFEYPFGFFVLSAGYKGDAMITEGLPSNNNFYIQTSFRIDRKVKPKKISSPVGF